MTIKIVKQKITQNELKKLAEESFGEMVKAVVDIEKEILAVGGGLHAEAEEILLKKGSQQKNLWGINIYPNEPENKKIEFSALINIRPSIGNRSMEIQNKKNC